MTGTTPAEVVAPVTTAIVTPPADNVTPAATGVVIASSSGSEVVAPTGTANTEWLASLAAESRELATKKNWKDVNAAIKSYGELERLNSTRVPATATTPETYTADAYKFTIPENAKAINYSEEFATGFRQFCVENGASPDFAAKTHDWYAKFATDSLGKQTTDYTAQVTAQVTAAEAELTTAWGATNNPAFKRNAELAQRAINQQGMMETLIEYGAVIDNNGVKTIADAKMFQMFAKMGQAMYAEDAVHGAAVTGGANPFDPKTSDMAVQGRLIQTDPEKALLYIQSLSTADQAMWRHEVPKIRARVGK